VGRLMLLICCGLFALTLSGCIGLIVNRPDECNNVTPFTGVHDVFRKQPKEIEIGPFGNVVPQRSSKNEFLKYWGKPDEIITTAENQETWLYNKRLWCGIIPVIILPIPLILPVCNGFDRIEFRGNEATRLRTKLIVSTVFVFILGGGSIIESDPGCPYPLYIDNNVDTDTIKPTTQATPKP